MAEQRDQREPGIDRVQLLLDKQDIYDAVVRYCRGFDRFDEKLALASFHDDAVVNYNGYEVPAAEWLPSSIAFARSGGVRECTHHICNHIVDVDGDVALSEASYLAFTPVEIEGRALDLWVAGRLVDRFERRDGVWRIAHRTTVYDWKRMYDPATVAGGSAYLAGLDAGVQGAPFPDDITYLLAVTRRDGANG
ncbi:nuclear transport factor 2 family protein [Microbacterium sp. X-17]|uniref:nuclear transport factor 2 family protein n=1 Tax=Microbacterium sp. X-17 TaxID=3144404 RepID=UPI0031F4D6FE